jgi:hypothetical protein
MAGLMFFVVTQKEIFDSTLAAVAAMGTAIPAFVKALGLTRDSGTALASARPPDNSAMDT